MFTIDKSKLDQNAVARYKDAPHVRRITDRLGGYDLLPKHCPYTGTTDHEYIEWLIQEAMIGYEPEQLDSQIPWWTRHHAQKAVKKLEGFPRDWCLGNDKTMTIRQLLEKARWFAKYVRESLDPSFTLARLEFDPHGEYEAAYKKLDYMYLGAIDAAEEFIAKETTVNNSPKNRRKLKIELESAVANEIVPVLVSAIPILQDMREVIAPAEDMYQ